MATDKSKQKKSIRFRIAATLLLPFQLVINQCYGGITLQSFFLIVIGWLITMGMLWGVLRLAIKK